MKFVLFLSIFSLIKCDLKDISGHNFIDLERDIEQTNNEMLKEELTEIKYLQEKLNDLKAENKENEAMVLERRINRKMETLREDIAHSNRFPRDGDFDGRIPGDIRGDIESRMREREELMRSRFDRDRENALRDRRGFDPRNILPDGDVPDDAHFRHHPHRHSPEDLHRVHKDISERHKELIDHREKDLTERIESAGFPPEEEAELKKKLERYLTLETEVMESRKSDKSPDRHAKFRQQTKDERLQDKESMKERRNQERIKMDEARELRKDIDTRIREKIASGRDL